MCYQRIIDSLHLQSNIDLYITGSNTYLLSNELATLLLSEYFQVAYTAHEESTLERELRPLRAISDYNQRTLLTLDLDPEVSYNGIQKVNAVDWLLQVS